MAAGRNRRPSGAVAGSAWLLLALAAAVTVIGCSTDEPPARSPLGPDTGTPSAATSTATGSPSPVVSVTATPPPAPASPSAPIAVDRELAIGKAIERMAQWLGIEQTDLVFESFAVQDFSNACLGVARPGIACAEVITPGASAVVLDRMSARHEVRMDAALQNFAWAPEVTATGRVTAVDHSAGTLTLDAGGTALRLRLAPGTLQDVSFSALAVGADLAVGFDRTPAENQPDVLAWISR